MTDNQRLARVLELLARVARKGPLSDKGHQVIGALWNAHCWEDESIAKAEFIRGEAEALATEAALRAGVPVDEWRQVADVPIDEFVLVTVSDPDIDGGKPYVAEAILCEAQDEGTHEWCMRPDYEGDGPHLLGGEVLAWRPLPAPYRPEETTDEQV